MTKEKSVWATLSAIDCSSKVEQKGKLTYLSWAWAWQTLMENYPDATYDYIEPACLSNGTVEVNVSVTVKGITHTMWLPVMDNRNKSIANPTTRDVSDARMRCLVKCIAMFGLGIYIYAGEDLPEATKTEIIYVTQAAEIKALLELTGADTKKFLQHYRANSVDEILAINFSNALAALQSKIK